MTSFRITTGLVVLLAVAVLGIPALAQTTGSIEGTALDAAGGTLPGVTIEVASPAMQGVRSTVTDASGRFRFAAVAPGAYTVTASLSGFEKVQRTATVSLDATAIVHFKLEMSLSREIVVTGEAPAVDTTSTTAGTNYTAKEITKLPLGRNYADVVRLQPGVQTDNGDTQGRSLALSIYGSTSAENLWLIDGVNTTNVIRGVQGKAINNEFVEEVEVKTGGYQAEYGRNTGGVVNVITKRGGNDFHGNAFGYLNTAGTEAANVNYQTPPYAQSGDGAATVDYPTNTRYELGASLGGYFIKDRLWFFGAYDYLDIRQNVRPATGVVAGQEFPALQNSSLWSGKVTFKLFDATELQAAGFADPQTNSGALKIPASANPNTYQGTRRLGGTDYAARLTHLTGSWGLFLFQYSRHEDSYTLSVSDIPRVTDVTAAVLKGVPATAYGGYGGVSGATNNNDSTRDSLAGSMSFFIGSHQLKAGGDYQKDLTSGFSYYSGGQAFTIYPCRQGVRNSTCDLTKAPFMDVAAGHIQVFYSHSYYVANGQDLTPTASSPFNAFSTSWSAYVQDEWKVLPNLSVNLGLRYDQQKVYKGDGTVAMDLKDQWAPRVGVSWDPLKDGSSKVYASAGRFYYNTPTDLNVRVFTATSSVGAVNYSPTDLTQDPTAPRKGFIQDGTFDGVPVDQGIKQAYQDEFTIGLEKALDPTFSLGAKFTYRTLGRTIEDRADLDPNDPTNGYSEVAFFNPGGSGPVASGAVQSCDVSESPFDPQAGKCGLPGVAMPAAKRIYRGIELLARKRVGDSLWLQASYLYSTLRGNYSGAVQTASGQTDPGLNADFDYYQLLDNADGYLELDHPHSFRIDGFWTAPFGLQAGLGVWARSGAPMSRMGYLNSGGYAAALFLDPRGTFGRTPTEWDADISLAYNWKVGPVVITPQIFIYRVFNNQQVTSYDTRFNPRGSFVTNTASPYYGQPGVEPGTGNCPAGGAPCSDGPDYMKVSRRSNPRQLRAAVKVAF